MSTRLDVEDVQTTKGEKLLAVVLAIAGYADDDFAVARYLGK